MKKIVLILLTITSIALFSMCKKKKLNNSLYDESIASGLSFYKGKDTIYSAKGSSPHGNFKLKFNAEAVKNLDASGKLPIGGTFTDGSLIVKEVYSGSSISLYAIMKKDSKSKFAKNGWVWAEFEPDGKVYYSVGKKGKDCISCHSSGNPRDLMLSFDLH